MKKISSTFLRFTFVDVLDDASKRSCTMDESIGGYFLTEIPQNQQKGRAK